MAAALVLHLGEDYSHRVDVMRSAGYTVEECSSQAAATGWFQAGKSADIVCITEAMGEPAEGLLAVTRHFTTAPIVLFRSANHTYVQTSWDLEVPLLTPPESWLRGFEALLASSQTARRESEQLRAESEQLRTQSAAERERTARLKEQSLGLQREGRRQVYEIATLWRNSPSADPESGQPRPMDCPKLCEHVRIRGEGDRVYFVTKVDSEREIVDLVAVSGATRVLMGVPFSELLA